MAADVYDIPVGDVELEGELIVPEGAHGLVVFAHGSGSSRKSPRNNAVADTLRERGLGTLLFDLLTGQEDQDRQNRFDIPLLTDRLVGVTDWAIQRPEAEDLNVGYFGASTGAAAALQGAVRRDSLVEAVVSRGGRVDMAEEALDEIGTACLFIVGGDDDPVLALNKRAHERLDCEKELDVIEGAGHLFQGAGELEEVSELALEWFDGRLGA